VIVFSLGKGYQKLDILASKCTNFIFDAFRITSVNPIKNNYILEFF